MALFRQNQIVYAEQFVSNTNTLAPGFQDRAATRMRIDYGAVWRNTDNDLNNAIPAGRPMRAVSFQPAVEIPRFTASDDSLEAIEESGWLNRFVGSPTEQVVEISYDRTEFDDHVNWVNYLATNYPINESTFDYTNAYGSPFSPSEVALLGLEGPTATGIARYDYNFNTQPYENSAIAGSNTPETILPHLYTFYLERARLDTLDPYDEFYDPTVAAEFIDFSTYRDFTTLDETIEDVSLVDIRLHREGYSLGYVDRSNYFTQWANQYPTSRARARVGKLSQRYENIIVPESTLTLMQNYNPYAELFPMYGDISFFLPEPSATSPSALSSYPYYRSLAVETSLINNLMRAVAADHMGSFGFTQNMRFAESKEIVRSEEATDSVVLGPVVIERDRRTFDFGKWLVNTSRIDSEEFGQLEGALEDFETAGFPREGAGSNSWLFLRNFENPADIDSASTMLSSAEAESVAYGISTRTTLNALARTFQEVWEGQEAHSEDLFFRVDKYRLVQGARESRPIQSYFVPNALEAHRTIRLIDTQVKYNENYEYEIMTYRLVVGSDTRITKVEVYSDSSNAFRAPTESDISNGYWTIASADAAEIGEEEPPLSVPFGDDMRDSFRHHYARITTQTAPSLKLIELPYLSNDSQVVGNMFGIGTVLDDPPLPPDVAVYPYKGVNDKLLFTFNTGVGSLQHPITPMGTETNNISYYQRLLMMARQVNPFQNTILYENDDPSVVYEVFKTTQRPTSYQAFADPSSHTRRLVETDDAGTGFERVSSAGYVDTVLPNTKYYYIFRAYDIHGHPSYPSPVYEVELLDVEGAIYPQIRTVPLLEEDSRAVKSKKLRRFLQIKPQVSQVVLDTTELESDTAPFTDALPMGIDRELVWGRRFKVRLTSKKTGKKIDLNINFTKEYDDTRMRD